MQNPIIIKAQLSVVAEFLAQRKLEATQNEMLTLLAKLQTAGVADAAAQAKQWQVTDGPQTEDQYARASGGHCPSCGSGDISGESVDIEGNEAHQRITCSNCHASWSDTYKLTGYSDLEGGIDLEAVDSVVEGVQARAKNYAFSINSGAQARELIAEEGDIDGTRLTDAETKLAVERLLSK